MKNPHGESSVLPPAGWHWEIVGGVTMAPFSSVLKYLSSVAGVPPHAFYPATRTRSDAPAVRRDAPPRAVFPPK